MDVAYISALSALAGSAIGGLTTGATTWLSQRAQARAEMLAREMSRRQDLYRDFIVAASKVYADAMMHDQPSVPDLVALYAMVSRMRVLSSPRVLACAETISRVTADTYFAPNRTISELHELIKQGAMDPLKDFSEAAREELLKFPPL
jgi:hypothetical protein